MPANPTGLRVDAVSDGAVGRLHLSGDLDADSVSALAEASAQLLADGHRDLVVDCTNLTFCDSFGLNALTKLWLQVQPGGSVTITEPSRMLSRILDITGLADQFGIAQCGRARPPTGTST